MISIAVDNSACKVSGLTKAQFEDLRSKMINHHRTGRWIQQIVKDKRTGKAICDPKTKKPIKKSVPEILKTYLMDRRGFFPTGLLYLVEDYFYAKSIKFACDDKRVEPELNDPRWAHIKTVRKFEPYHVQVAAAAAAIEYGRGIIVGPTGIGKSVIAAEIIDAFRVPTLVVVPSLELKRQLTEGLREYFGPSSVGPLLNGQPERLVTVENVDALDPESKLNGIDLVIVDEFHHSGAETYRKLNMKSWSGVYHKIGMTATPFRSQESERLLLESVLSQVIYRIEYQYAVEQGYIVPLEVYYVDLPEVSLKCSENDFRGVYRALVVERADRNQIIAQMAANLERSSVSALVLVKQVLHGKLIEGALLQEGVQIPFVKGENDDNREVIQAFNRRAHNAMMGTNGILGEGVDTKPCEFVIIAGLGKSKNAFMQQIGRCFRKYPGKESGKAVIFRDPSHKWTLEHFEAQCEYLMTEYGIKPIKLDI